MHCRIGLVACLAFALAAPDPASAYGISGHLRTVFESTKQNNQALAMAESAGALTSDIGYLVDTLMQFSKGLHYLHSGDIAHTAIEYADQLGGSDKDVRQAFATGLGSHYWADRIGHNESTNRIVASMIREAGKPGPALRQVYENDENLHLHVEARSVAFDWRLASATFEARAEQFIVGVMEFETLILGLGDFMQKLLDAKYAHLGVKFDSRELLRYMRFSAKLLCEGLESEQKAAQLQRGFFSTLRACANLRKFLADRKHEDSLTMTQKLKLVGTPLSSDPKKEQQYAGTYDRSHAILADHLKKAQGRGTGPFSQYNLDTNLPAAGGTYRTADLTVRKLTKDPAKLFPHFIGDGKTMRARFTAPFRASKEAADLILAGDTEKLAQHWLWGLLPDYASFRNLAIDVRPSCNKRGTPLSLPGFPPPHASFAVDGKTVCAQQGQRVLELLFALGQAAALNGMGAPPEAGWNGAYEEALDRLRLRAAETGKQDANGLYRP